MSRNVDKLSDMFPKVAWQRRGDGYVGRMGDQTVAFSGDMIKDLFKNTKKKNAAQLAVTRSVDEMKAKAWNSNGAN